MIVRLFVSLVGVTLIAVTLVAIGMAIIFGPICMRSASDNGARCSYPAAIATTMFFGLYASALLYIFIVPLLLVVFFISRKTEFAEKHTWSFPILTVIGFALISVPLTLHVFGGGWPPPRIIGTGFVIYALLTYFLLIRHHREG